MNNSHKGFIAPLFLIVIALLIVGGGTYVYQEMKQANPSVTEGSAAQSPWKTYQNKEFGFVINTPSSWVQGTLDKNGMVQGTEFCKPFSSTSTDCAGSTDVVDVQVVETYGQYGWVTSKTYTGPTDPGPETLGGQVRSKLKDVQPISLNGIEGFSGTDIFSNGTTMRNIVVGNGTKVYVISYNLPESSNDSQITKTFNFLN